MFLNFSSFLWNEDCESGAGRELSDLLGDHVAESSHLPLPAPEPRASQLQRRRGGGQGVGSAA